MAPLPLSLISLFTSSPPHLFPHAPSLPPCPSLYLYFLLTFRSFDWHVLQGMQLQSRHDVCHGNCIDRLHFCKFHCHTHYYHSVLYSYMYMPEVLFFLLTCKHTCKYVCPVTEAHIPVLLWLPFQVVGVESCPYYIYYGRTLAIPIPSILTTVCTLLHLVHAISTFVEE